MALSLPAATSVAALQRHAAKRAAHSLKSPFDLGRHVAAYLPGRVIVGYRPSARARTAARVARVLGARQAATPSARTRILRLPRGTSVTAALRRLRHRPGVAFAVPDYVAHVDGQSQWFPNDRGPTHRFGGWESIQWNFMPQAGVDAPTAWANLRGVRRPGGHREVVAILDTGIAYRNWRGFKRSPDFSHTRFVAPYDFLAKNRFPLDRNGHGTFVAGIVGESTDNIFGLTGIAYGASIMPVRVINSEGQGDEVTIARGIRYAVTHGADIINLSIEFSPYQVRSASDIPDITSALAFAHRRGVVVVASAGNDELDHVAFPARERHVISVGASTRDRCVANYSNVGRELDVVAPGGGEDAIAPTLAACQPDRLLPSIKQLTLVNPPHWHHFGYPQGIIGTSMSAPEVAATAALVMASGVIGRHPSPEMVELRLEETAVPLGPKRHSRLYGFGLVNAGLATNPHIPPPPNPN